MTILRKSVSLQPNESKVVSFQFTPAEAKAYQVLVNGLTGSFEALPQVAEPELTALDLPSVPSGGKFYPEYTLFLPKPWNTVETPLYHFDLWVDHPSGSASKRAKLVSIAIMPYQADTVVAPPDAWLSNPDGEYTYRGTYLAMPDAPWQRYWGASQAIWGDDTFMEPGTYVVKGSISAVNCIGITSNGYEYTVPQESYALGVVGSLTITEQVLPDPVMAGRILYFRGYIIGDWEPTTLRDDAVYKLERPDDKLGNFEDGYLGIAFHNDTIISGTSAEVDPRRAEGPLQIAVTLDGSPWWISEVFYYEPCKSDTLHTVDGWIWAPKFPPLGYHTLTATLLSNGKVLDTYTINITVI